MRSVEMSWRGIWQHRPPLRLEQDRVRRSTMKQLVVRAKAPRPGRASSQRRVSNQAAAQPARRRPGSFPLSSTIECHVGGSDEVVGRLAQERIVHGDSDAHGHNRAARIRPPTLRRHCLTHELHVGVEPLGHGRLTAGAPSRRTGPARAIDLARASRLFEAIVRKVRHAGVVLEVESRYAGSAFRASGDGCISMGDAHGGRRTGEVATQLVRSLAHASR